MPEVSMLSIRAVSKSILVVAVAVVVAVAGGAAYFIAQPAPVGGKILMYCALHEFECQRILTGFKEDTGIDGEFVRLSAGEVLTRLRAEKASPKADVFLGGPSSPFHTIAQKEEILLPYASSVGKAIDARFKSKPEGYWYGFYLGAIGFAVNEGVAKKKNVPIPQTWDDLLKPEYKGEIVMAKPYTSGTSYTIVATVLMKKGEAAGWSYLEALNKNIKKYTSSGAAPARDAALGEFMIGISFGHDILKPIDAGYGVKLIYPKDGSGYEIGGVSVIKGGPNPEGAKKFIDWMLGTKGGQLHTDLSFRISTRPDVKSRPGTVPLSDISLIDFNFDWASDNFDRVVAEWRNRIEKA